MRVMVEVATAATELDWRRVHAPGRGIFYGLLSRAAPLLAAVLHDKGWGPYRMVPIGYGAPLFPYAGRRKGKYAVGGPGLVEFGSPVEPIAEALAEEVSRQRCLNWGGVEFHITRVGVLDPPSFSDGRARMKTRTPVLMKGRDESGQRPTREGWLLPNEPGFSENFVRNLTRKAETLGFDPDIQLTSILGVGPKRSFSVGRGAKPGATIDVELQGDSDVLRALWSWGLGQSNSAGFGWIAATE